MPKPRRVGPINVHQTCADGQPGHPLDRAKVSVRMGNFSAFSGYHFTPSDYSEVVCGDCGTRWRTKARYVDRLPGTSQ